MLLATRCPHCDTVFRLQQEQLSLHEGLVRCGHCRQVFNASQSLVPEHAAAAEPTALIDAAATATEPATAQAGADATPAQQAAPTRLFDVDTPAAGALSPHTDYKPEGWDMWAPWLDGGVDPALQHNGQTVRTEPLVPLAPPSTDAGVVHLTGTPTSFAPSPAEPVVVTATEAPASAPAESRSTPPVTEAPAVPIVPPTEQDLREPHFVAHFPSDAKTVGAAAEPAVNAPFALPDDERAPREPHFAFAPVQAAPEPESEAASAPAPAATRRDTAPATAASDPAAPFPIAPSDDRRPHFAVTRETRAPQRRGLLGGFFGGLVAAVLAVLLVAQLAWWQREALMIYWPVTQGWFRQVCAPLGCTVAPPRAIDGLRLDATDLRQLDGPRVLELKVPLTNRYRVALAYPSLELTLLDDTNHVTVRRVLAPQEYVRPGTPLDAGLAPGTTQTMIVRVETNGAPASNFRVQIFYP
ncbi:DUF3426 domain-containing protein [Burkholderia stagnalis]